MLRSIPNMTKTVLTRTWLNLNGRWQFLRGRNCASYELAYETFHQLLDEAPRSFTAHFFLGQIARERGQARLAFDHYLAAYSSSITRFNRSGLPDDLKNHIALRHGLGRTQKVAIHEFDETPAPLLQDGYNHAPEPEAHFDIHLANHGDYRISDFRSQEEAERFESMPPITAEELENVDLDVLIGQLQGKR